MTEKICVCADVFMGFHHHVWLRIAVGELYIQMIQLLKYIYLMKELSILMPSKWAIHLVKDCMQWSLLLTWINFNPSMDK